MMLVIVSGIYGISVYALLPQGLSDSRAEMTGPQMIDAVNSLDQQIQIAAQPLVRRGQRSRARLARRGSVRRRRLAPADRQLSALRQPRGRCSVHARAAGRARRASRQPAIEQVVDAARAQGGGAAAAARLYPAVRALLEVWLYVHVPLTFALIAALLAHIISVFFYW